MPTPERLHFNFEQKLDPSGAGSEVGRQVQYRYIAAKEATEERFNFQPVRAYISLFLLAVALHGNLYILFSFATKMNNMCGYFFEDGNI